MTPESISDQLKEQIVTLVRTPGGFIATIPGGESRIISMEIDKAGKILPERYVNEIKSALDRDREIRKANIGAG